MAIKITKTDKFNILADYVADLPEDNVLFSTVSQTEMLEFIDHEIELIAKKNARKGSGGLTKNQKENADLAMKIFNLLAVDRWYTATEICDEIAPTLGKFSTQKITQILFRRADLFDNKKDGKKSLYKIVAKAE